MKTMDMCSSPVRKLALIFQKGRDIWKRKCQQAKRKLKKDYIRIRDLKASRDAWKAKAMALKKQVAILEQQLKLSSKKKSGDLVINSETPAMIDHHQYNVMTICISIALVFKSIALRATEKALRVFTPEDESSPRYHTIRAWILRLGLFTLNQPKPQASDWIWFIDHSVQIGKEKCLVVLGIQLSTDSTFPLCITDMIPLLIEPCSQSNRMVVARQLETVAQKAGVPRGILSDGGPDLKSGIMDYLETHPDVDYFYDIKHKCSIELKHILSQNNIWDSFCREASQFKLQIQQTSLAPLCPPSQRSKSRFMNIDILLKWVREIMIPTQTNPQEVSAMLGVKPEIIVEKTAWFMHYAPYIQQWIELYHITSTVTHILRSEGYHAGTEKILTQTLQPPVYDDARKLQSNLVTFTHEQCQKVHPDERIPASTEVIESLFGKFKNFENEQSRCGFSLSVLAMSAMTSPCTPEVVFNALSEVRTQDVLNWGKENLPETTSKKREKIRNTFNNKELIWHEIYGET